MLISEPFSSAVMDVEVSAAVCHIDPKINQLSLEKKEK